MRPRLLLLALLLAGCSSAEAGGVWQPPHGDLAKIDSAATLGLLGPVANSLSYRVHELERHFHGRDRWFGKLAVQTATDWADNTLTPYVCTSGAGAYGTDANDEAKVVGTADTPVIAGMVKFDLHQLLAIDASVTTVWKVRLTYGTGTQADAIAAGQYSTMMLRVDTAGANIPTDPLDLMMPRGTCGSTQVWIDCWNATENATLDFVVGLHEYEG